MTEEIPSAEEVLRKLKLAGENMRAANESLEDTAEQIKKLNRKQRRELGMMKRGNSVLNVEFKDRNEHVAVRRAIKRISGSRKKVR